MNAPKKTEEAAPVVADAPVDELAALRDDKLAEPIAELEKLLAQSRRAFLIGAGCSRCAGLPLMDGLTDEVLKDLPEKEVPHTVLATLQQDFDGAKGCNIEDYMSELVDLISIAERKSFRGAKSPTAMIGDTSFSVDDLRTALDAIKAGIAKSLSGDDLDISHHRSFVRAMHGTLLSGKALPSHAVDYFTLNYDTLLEDALALERVPFADGFIGGATGWWEVAQYGRDNALARVFKVHGSIDWCLLDNDPRPCRMRGSLRVDGDIERVMIWPAATKYREAQRDPYAQLVAHMRQTLRPAANSEVMLGICGYAFGDAHINLELDRALRESEKRLTVVCFTNDNEPQGQLKAWFEDSAIRDQVRIHANRGFYHGDNVVTTDADLLWWKFEVLTRLLGGER